MKLATRQNERVAFVRFVDGEVLRALSMGATSFTNLLRRLPSVYPTELLASIERLLVRCAIPSSLAERFRCEAAQLGNDQPEGRSLLPLPHPLDFEWRFTSDAARDLLNLATELTPSDGDVLLFGTPGLAVEALSLPTSRRLSFLGEDNIVTRRVMALNQATGSPLSIAFCSGALPRASADAVLVDPPWYMDFIRPMLEAAAAACRLGGAVLLSLPPIGTRPSAGAEFAATIRFAARLGLDLIRHEPLTIGYDTPFFEINALSAAGVHASSRWRRGDLIVLRKARSTSRLSPPVSGRRRDWVEASIGRMRLFIRIDSDAGTGFEGLIPLIGGNVLPSVSRRDFRRRHAQVWTSGNRIFRTDNPALVFEAALSHSEEAFGSGLQPRLWGNLRECEALERVSQELHALAVLEASEERGSPAIVPEWGGHWISSSTRFCSTSAATLSG
jgi:hypothetical protein